MRFRKIKQWTALLLAALLCLPAGSLAAGSRRAGSFLYEVQEDGTAKIVEYSDQTRSDEVALEIPAEVEGIPVTAIGDNVFMQKTKLVSVVIPEGVRSIGSKAFSACDGIVSVQLPSTLESIGSRAFSSCKGLRSVELPLSLKTLGENPFAMCDNLTEVVIDPDHPVFKMENGSLVSREDCRLIAFFHQTDGGNYTVPEDVRVIGSVAFAYSGELERLILSEGLEKIEDSAFARCTALKEVVLPLPASLKSMGNKVFSDCAALTTVELPDTLTELSGNPFVGCSALTDIRISGSHPVLENRDGVLIDRAEHRLVCFPKSLEVQEYEVPADIRVIGTSAFESVFDGARETQLRKIVLPEGLVRISDFAFSACKGLEEINLPETLEEIGIWAFESCQSLKEIRVPSGVKVISSCAFSRCGNLETVGLSDGLEEIGSNAFDGCFSLKSIEMPASVTVYGSYAFNNCNALEKVRLPYHLTALGTGLFNGCSALREVNLPIVMTVIPERLFRYCSSLETVSLPPYLRKISASAFEGCSALKEIRFPDSLRIIGEAAFEACVSLRDIVLPEGMKNLHKYAFNEIPELRSIVLPGSLENIGYNALPPQAFDLVVWISVPGSPAEVYCEENAFEFCYPEGGTVPEEEELSVRETGAVMSLSAPQETEIFSVWEEVVSIREEETAEKAAE